MINFFIIEAALQELKRERDHIQNMIDRLSAVIKKQEEAEAKSLLPMQDEVLAVIEAAEKTNH